MSFFIIIVGAWVVYAYVQVLVRDERRARWTEPDTEGSPFSVFDMLMPARKLAGTNWRDNPLMVYTRRRSRRFWRFALTRLFALALIAIGSALAASAFLWITITRVALDSDWLKILAANHESKVSSYIVLIGNGTPYAFFLFTFVMLRYHLLVNDQSGHIKSLSRERLGELLLTQLGSEEYFLHHFLMFCRRYEVVVGWAAIWAVMIACDVLHGGVTWVEPDLYSWLFMMLFVVLAVWIAGTFQYVLEWQWFAGGRARKWRILPSLGISLVIAGLVNWLTMHVYAWNMITLRMPITFTSRPYGVWPSNLLQARRAAAPSVWMAAIWLALGLFITFWFGKHVYHSALRTLRGRYDPDRKRISVAQEILRYRE